MRADLPLAYRVADRVTQTRDCATLTLEPIHAAVPDYRPGQFMMLYAFGVGEVAISVSGGARDGGLEHTIRSVGAVSKALHDRGIGSVIGVRGPFGTGWNVEFAAGRDVVVVAGGVGLAPLRTVVLHALANRDRFGQVVLVVGARTPDDLLFRDELARWARDDRIQLIQTVDAPAPHWSGRVGFVTEPLAQLGMDPTRTTAFLCGPEPMMRYCAQTLLRKNVPAQDIQVSLERNMQCGTGLCGHCQLGPLLVCRDGPIVDYATAADLLSIREL